MRIVTCLALLSLVACPAPDDGGDPAVDSGAAPARDGGQGTADTGTAAADAGQSPVEDAGTLPPVDAGGTPVVDAGGGEEPEDCGGIAGLQCANRDDFCNQPAGMCQVNDMIGACTEVPQVCGQNIDPVCGCDGIEYDNDCVRLRARVQLDHVGRCDDAPPAEDVCGGVQGLQCDRGQFCDPTIGMCHVEDAMGICVELPQGCNGDFDPVCGCDGETYDNDCRRVQAGIALDHVGACDDGPPPGDQCGGFAGIPCDPRQFCNHPPDSCGIADGMGVCVDVPADCGREHDPVCGCNGVTYDNDCRRIQAGVQVENFGACGGDPEPPNACMGNGNCGDTEFCEKVVGQCRGQGLCNERPQNCTMQVDPVCGCDGQTYNNGCFAHRAGISVAREGRCED